MGISQWQDAERGELEVALRNCGERWAAEVKELNARIEELEAHAKFISEDLNAQIDVIQELEAENEKFREALTRVAFYGGVYRCKERRAIARAALQGGQGK